MNIKKNLEMFFSKSRKSRIKTKEKASKQFDITERFLAFLFSYILFLFSRFLKLVLKRIIFFLRTDEKNNFLYCPIRGRIGTKIYDELGDFTEEYHRINLVNFFLKKGFPNNSINLNYRIRIGHKGKNFFIPDIVITRNDGTFFLVGEIKKYSKDIRSAINHQLNPAMKILNSDYGIYYDGTKNSTFFSKNGEVLKNFDFSNLPDWIIQEWKKDGKT
jgi:hypothetical protein